MRLAIDAIWPRLLRRTVGRLGWLERLNLSVPVNIRTGTVRIPFLAGHGVDTADEPWLTDLLEPLLRLRAGTFVDVGVNLGQTLLKVKALEPGRRVLGFEPNPICVRYVHELVRLNHFADVEIVPAGLFTSDEVLALELFSASEVDSAASLVPDYRPGERVRRRVLVPVVRWETAVRNLDVRRLAILKIDVEGAEREVLSTMTAAIRKGADLLRRREVN